MFSEFLLSLVWLARDAALALCSGHHLSKMAAQNGCQSIISWPFGSKPSLVQSRPANQWLKMAENVNTWLPILLGPVQIKYPKWRKKYFFSCPLQSRPLASSDQAGRYSIIKMVEKYYLFLVQFNPDPGPIQIKLAGTQNGGKTMFHLPPQWQQV